MDKIAEGELAPRKSWWGRNWLWVVPSGCLGLLLSCGCLGALGFFGIFKSMSSSDAFTQAVSRAQKSPEVVAALGEPITASWQVQGSVQSGTGGGTAHFTIPLKGPKAEGSLHVEAAKKAGGEWTYSTLTVSVPDHPEIDLLGGAPTAPRDTARPQDELPQVEPLPDEDTGGAEPADPPAEPPAPRPGKGHKKGKGGKSDVEL